MLVSIVLWILFLMLVMLLVVAIPEIVDNLYRKALDKRAQSRHNHPTNYSED